MDNKTMVIKCPAKINLSLDVLNKREDGFHNLKMIMQEIPLYDILTISLFDTPNILEVTCNNSFIPQNNDNIVAKAVNLFFDTIKQHDLGVKIHIEKNIPFGAGLGGGSSNAAGVLKALNALFENKLTLDKLSEIGGRIGSDVPFFIHGGCMLAEGIGTSLTPVISNLKNLWLLLAKPNFSVSTAHVYQSLHLNSAITHPNTDALLVALQNNDIHAFSQNTANVLEFVTATEHKEITEYKTIMKKAGAACSLMSGSGPTVFGIFEKLSDAEAASMLFKEKTNEVFVLQIN